MLKLNGEVFGGKYENIRYKIIENNNRKKTYKIFLMNIIN